MKNINLIKMILLLLLVSSCSSNNKTINDKSKSFDNNKLETLDNADKNNIMFLKTIYYDFNSFKLRREAKQNLDLLAKYLLQNNNKNKTINLYGYCDDVGTNDYNYNLG